MEKRLIEAKLIDMFLDGGTLQVLTEDGTTYYVDRRLKTKTPDGVYTDYPGEPTAKYVPDLQIKVIEQQPPQENHEL
jgi:hypothetical protein